MLLGGGWLEFTRVTISKVKPTQERPNAWQLWRARDLELLDEYLSSITRGQAMFKFWGEITGILIGYYIALIPRNPLEIEWLHGLYNLISDYMAYIIYSLK